MTPCAAPPGAEQERPRAVEIPAEVFDEIPDQPNAVGVAAPIGVAVDNNGVHRPARRRGFIVAVHPTPRIQLERRRDVETPASCLEKLPGGTRKTIRRRFESAVFDVLPGPPGERGMDSRRQAVAHRIADDGIAIGHRSASPFTASTIRLGPSRQPTVPGSMKSNRSPSASATASAVLAGSEPLRFADVETMASPKAWANARAWAWSGTRTATVSRPPVIHSGNRRLGTTQVTAPGQLFRTRAAVLGSSEFKFIRKDVGPISDDDETLGRVPPLDVHHPVDGSAVEGIAGQAPDAPRWRGRRRRHHAAPRPLGEGRPRTSRPPTWVPLVTPWLRRGE